MKIAIIGAGLTGLTLGFYLSKKGHRLAIYEKNDFIGGLASGFKLHNAYLERFYHHIFKSDRHIQVLAKDLGFNNLWLWKSCGAPIFYNAKIYPFSSALDLLSFSPISFLSRVRTGIVSLYLQFLKDYRIIESHEASCWLKKWMGKESWQVIWQPLMKKKFGREHEEISMSWMWARIHKRSTVLGYPEKGFQIIINKLADEIKKNKGEIKLRQEVKDLKQLNGFDKIVFTGASPLFTKIIPGLPDTYKQKLNKIKYLGTVSLVLILKRALTDWVYWLNINEQDIPFVACVQQTNLVSAQDYNNLHPLYLTAYTDTGTELYKSEAKDIFDQWTKKLVKINRNFNNSWIKEYQLFKEPYTQPLFKVGSGKQIAGFETPMKNVYLVNMSQIYPWDRGLNQAVEISKNFLTKYF